MGKGHAAAGFSAGLALGAGDGDVASVVVSAGLAVRATGLAFFLFAAFVFFLAAFFLPVVLGPVFVDSADLLCLPPNALAQLSEYA